MARYDVKCGVDSEPCLNFFTCSMSEYDFVWNTVKNKGCEIHHSLWKRTYLPFGFTMPLADGFSPATGTYVSGNRNLREQFKIASEQATERTGIPHNFQPVDMRDTETLGITEEGLADDNRTRHDRGEPVVTAPGLDV